MKIDGSYFLCYTYIREHVVRGEIPRCKKIFAFNKRRQKMKKILETLLLIWGFLTWIVAGCFLEQPGMEYIHWSMPMIMFLILFILGYFVFKE